MLASSCGSLKHVSWREKKRGEGELRMSPGGTTFQIHAGRHVHAGGGGAGSSPECCKQQPTQCRGDECHPFRNGLKIAFAAKRLHGRRKPGDAPRQSQQLLGAKLRTTVLFHTDRAPGSPRPPPPILHQAMCFIRLVL